MEHEDVETLVNAMLGTDDYIKRIQTDPITHQLYVLLLQTIKRNIELENKINSDE